MNVMSEIEIGKMILKIRFLKEEPEFHRRPLPPLSS